jgi:hypothetical protein
MNDDLFDWGSSRSNGKSRADQIFTRFKKFHRDNPRIWELYKKFAFAVMDSGVSHYSSNAVFQRIRWHVDIETRSSDSVKLNDHYHAYYSRMFAAVYPQYADFFQFRKRLTADRPAYRNDISVFHTGEAEDEEDLMATLKELGSNGNSQ